MSGHISKTEWYPVLVIDEHGLGRQAEIPAALLKRYYLVNIEFDAVQEELGKLYWTPEELAE